MGTSIVLSLLLSISSVLAQVSNASVRCVPADGGESPIISYSSNASKRLILNDGSEIGWGDEVFRVSPSINEDIYSLSGLVSAELVLGGESGDTQKVDFLFDLITYDGFLSRWLEKNSDLLDDNDRYATKRVTFTCELYRY